MLVEHRVPRAFLDPVGLWIAKGARACKAHRSIQSPLLSYKASCHGEAFEPIRSEA